MPGDPSGKESKEALHLWCFDLTYIPRAWQFIILTTLTFAFYLVYGYMQVRINFEKKKELAKCLEL